MLNFLLGLAVGAFAGMFLAALLFIMGRDDDDPK